MGEITAQDVSAIASLGLLLAAILSLIYVAREYSLRKRPFVDIQIGFQADGTDWHFLLVLVNHGSIPCVAKITRAMLRVGDENYPTEFAQELVLSPKSTNTISHIGHVNETGRKKILGNQYQQNRCEIEVEVRSKPIGARRFRRLTSCLYQVEVTGDQPSFTLHRQTMS